MAMNPMQRRATRSFVIGLVLGLMASTLPSELTIDNCVCIFARYAIV